MHTLKTKITILDTYVQHNLKHKQACGNSINKGLAWSMSTILLREMDGLNQS